MANALQLGINATTTNKFKKTVEMTNKELANKILWLGYASSEEGIEERVKALVEAEKLIEAHVIDSCNEALTIPVVGQGEQLICDTCKSGLIDYPEINRRTCRCGGLGYNVTD